MLSAVGPMVPPLDRDSFSAAGGHLRADSWYDDAGIERARTLIWLYNGTGAALVALEPMVLRHDGDADVNPKVAVATESPVGVTEFVVAPLESLAIGVWGWFVIAGYTEVYVNGGTVDCAKDDYLKMDVTVDDDALANDGTTRTPNSCAIYSDDTSETDTTASTRLVFLFGRPVAITAS